MYIADLHIHSKYSRATSRDCDAPHLELWARKKGIGLVGTGDFTHPAWRQELAEVLEPAEDGFYTLKEKYCLPCDTSGSSAVRFVVTGEISSIYKKNGKTRKVHNLIVLPGLEAAENLSRRLEAIGLSLIHICHIFHSRQKVFFVKTKFLWVQRRIMPFVPHAQKHK